MDDRIAANALLLGLADADGLVAKQPPSSVHSQASSALECPITHELFREPVLLVATGHTYELRALDTFLSVQAVGKWTDPLSNQRIKDPTVAPNWSVRKLVQAFLDANPSFVPSGWPDRSIPKCSLESAGWPPSLAAASEVRKSKVLAPGTHVDYWSATLGHWMESTVQRQHSDGRCDLQGRVSKPRADPSLIMLHDSARIEKKAVRPGTQVLYMSASSGQWLPGVVERLRQHDGRYDLDIRRGADPARLRLGLDPSRSRELLPAVDDARFHVSPHRSPEPARREPASPLGIGTRIIERPLKRLRGKQPLLANDVVRYLRFAGGTIQRLHE